MLSYTKTLIDMDNPIAKFCLLDRRSFTKIARCWFAKTYTIFKYRTLVPFHRLCTLHTQIFEIRNTQRVPSAYNYGHAKTPLYNSNKREPSVSTDFKIHCLFAVSRAAMLLSKQLACWKKICDNKLPSRMSFAYVISKPEKANNRSLREKKRNVGKNLSK